jgi:Do/DeqQ family serine protease
MHRFWLLFSQFVAAIAVVVAALFGLDRIAPGLLPFNGAAVTIREVANEVAQSGGARQAASYADAASKSQPSVVNIFTSKEVRSQRNPLMDDPLFRRFFGDRFPTDNRPQRVSNLGSGVIVSEDGFILTNHHVVESADEIQVALSDGLILDAKVVGTDPETDLAVLKVKRDKMPAITFAKSDMQRVGDVVLAIGNPFGVGQTVTMGIISALGRSHLGINTFENYIQTDAAINPGNSGGALVDVAGNLVGVNTAIFSRSGGNLGIGFAIPISIVRQVMQEIIANGAVTRGWVGIEVQEITPELAESFKLSATQGALIAGVMRGSPADKAGIKPGDVLTQVTGKPVKDAQVMLELIAALEPGKTASFSLKREGRDVTLDVTIGKRPKPPKE